jgi:hypothetical protein
MAKNLFKKAVSKAVKKEKNEKITISVEDPQFFKKVKDLEEIQDRMKSDKAKSDFISSDLKEIGKSEYCKVYNEIGKNPGSIVLEQVEGDDVARLMYVPSDRYITINKERAEELSEIYGEDIVEEKVTFSFDNNMIEKYGEILSRLIEESDEIDETDKEKIIKATCVYSISGSTIDKLKDYGDVSEIIEQVRPVVSLKGVEVIKG